MHILADNIALKRDRSVLDDKTDQYSVPHLGFKPVTPDILTPRPPRIQTASSTAEIVLTTALYSKAE